MAAPNARRGETAVLGVGRKHFEGGAAAASDVEVSMEELTGRRGRKASPPVRDDVFNLEKAMGRRRRVYDPRGGLGVPKYFHVVEDDDAYFRADGVVSGRIPVFDKTVHSSGRKTHQLVTPRDRALSTTPSAKAVAPAPAAAPPAHGEASVADSGAQEDPFRAASPETLASSHLDATGATCTSVKCDCAARAREAARRADIEAVRALSQWSAHPTAHPAASTGEGDAAPAAAASAASLTTAAASAPVRPGGPPGGGGAAPVARR